MQFVNSSRGKPYEPHHEAERAWVEDDKPRYALARGGEGGGKSVAGIVKTLNRLRRGMTGIFVSPDLEHFKKSLWPEFRRWCPVEAVVESQRYRLKETWEPRQPFALHFTAENGQVATLWCGGIDDPESWEGPNVNFAHFDEARRHDKPSALKVLDGRVRIPGPKGEPPQIWLTTTPRKHWLFDYFGPKLENDPLADFKAEARDLVLLSADNEKAGNLEEGYTRLRGLSLTESEKRVLLEAAWEDIEEPTRFLQSMIWWDDCKVNPESLNGQPLIAAMDAGVTSDCFGLVAISQEGEKVRARYSRAWIPQPNKPLDFDSIESDIRVFCKSHNVKLLVYDPYQLHQMGTRLNKDGVVLTEEFPQGAKRAAADKNLFDMIMAKRFLHDGNPELRQHVDNADKKVSQDRTIRIVKRLQSLKIDLCVAASMAAYASLAYKQIQPASSGRVVGL